MTKHNDKQDGLMNKATLAKLVEIRDSLTHAKHAVMASNTNPFDGVPTEEIRAYMAVVCTTAAALQAECDAASDEIARREPPSE